MDVTKVKIGFIGTGKIATAIAGGLVNSKLYKQDQFMGSDKKQTSLEKFMRKTSVSNTMNDNIAVAQACEIIILAVKPQQMEEVCREIADVCKDKLIISIAAGLNFEYFYNILGHKRIIRVMPNTPVIVCQGACAFSVGKGCKESDRLVCLNIFSTIGRVYQVEENQMDAVTAISGIGPAYVYQFIKYLAEAGTKLGLDPQVSMDLVNQTVFGASCMISLQQGSIEELTKSVSSQNGPTEAALQEMQKLNFKQSLDTIVSTCQKRVSEIGESENKIHS